MSIPKNIKDHYFSKENFEIKLNKELGSYRTDPIPNNLNEYYNSSAYVSHQEVSRTFFDKIYSLIRQFQFRLKLSWLKKKNKNCLDIGSGNGLFLKYLTKKGFKVQGVEPFNTISSDKIVASLDEINDSFENVCMWHVLEHVVDLVNYRNQIDRVLENEGQLFIAVPNYLSFDAKFYKGHWAAFDVPRHVHHFNDDSLIKLFDDYELIKIKALWFDAFYVSLLSEKYKQSGILGMFRAILIALISNLFSLFTGQFSSKVYVFKK